MSSIALCIPAYNAEVTLPRLLQSALSQSCQFDEIIVYNDGSSDNTSAIASQYGATVIEGGINVGCSTGKNRIAELAKSEWLHFHDADDELLPNFMEVAKSWIDNPSSADIILLNYEYKDFHTETVLGYANFNREVLLTDQNKFILNHKLVNFALIKRSSFIKIGGFDLDPKVLYNEDRAFYSRAMLADLRFDYEPEVTCINYRYAESMSNSNRLNCAYAHFEVSKKTVNKIDKKYYRDIGKNILDNAKILASCQEWVYTRKSLMLAKKLGTKLDHKESRSFKFLYSLQPFFAFWLREKLIRMFKPHLRRSV